MNVAAPAEKEESRLRLLHISGFLGSCRNCAAPVKRGWKRCPGCKTKILEQASNAAAPGIHKMLSNTVAEGLNSTRGRYVGQTTPHRLELTMSPEAQFLAKFGCFNSPRDDIAAASGLQQRDRLAVAARKKPRVDTQPERCPEHEISLPGTPLGADVNEDLLRVVSPRRGDEGQRGWLSPNCSRSATGNTERSAEIWQTVIRRWRCLELHKAWRVWASATSVSLQKRASPLQQFMNLHAEIGR
jgi:hypothetical protein